MIRAICAIVAVAVAVAGGSVAARQTPDEAALRAAIQQYYDAQVREDVGATLAAWSRTADAPPPRETLQAVFDTGRDEYTVDVRSLAIDGADARVRLLVNRVRTVQEDGRDRVYRSSTFVNEVWRREAEVWRLVRERPAVEDFADTLLAASADRRDALLAGNADLVNDSLRDILVDRASRLSRAGKFDEALPAFQIGQLVAHALHDRTGEIQILQNIANAYYFARDFTRAADYYQRELALAQEAESEELTASALIGVATVAYSRGEYGPALGSYRDALAIYERRNEGPSVGRALVSVGNVQYLLGDYDAAAASYARARDLLVKAPDFPGASMARRGLGRVFAAQGDLAAALQAYGEVLQDPWARLSRSEAAAALESIGEIHYRLGNADQARAAFDEARRDFDALQDLESAGRVFGDLGLTEIVANRPDAALVAYTGSRGRYERAKRPDGVAHAWVGTGFAQAARDKFTEAIAAYRTAIALFDEENRREESARAWLGLSMAQSGAGDADAALESARHVRAAADALGSDEVRWRGAAREGEALRQLARFDEAQHAFEDAIATIERMVPEAATSGDVRTALDDSPSAWAGLAFTLAARHDAAGALLAAERRHAHIRQVTLAPFERDITRGATPEEQADEQQTVRDLISVRAQVRAERTAPHPDAARLAGLQPQVAQLSTRRADQQSRLYARLPDLRVLRGLVPPGDLHDVNPSEHALLVEYVVGDDGVLVLSAAKGENGPAVDAAIVAVKRSALADTIARALDPVSLRDAAEWRTRAGALAQSLLAPVAARLGCGSSAEPAASGRPRDLVIVPDDLLWRVPFEALPMGDGEPACGASVTYAASLVTLARHAAAPARTAPAFAAIAAPQLSAAVTTSLAATNPGWTPPDATAATALAQDAAKAYEAATLTTGADATPDALQRALTNADVVAVSAPLQVAGGAPLFSSVLLTPAGESSTSDGRFELRRWFGVNAGAGVVVLSDGSSFARPGSSAAMEVLDWAAAAAGIPVLVIARAPSDVFAVAPLLSAFHARLAKGERPGAAWHAATAGARATGGAAPATWAGLRLVGQAR